MRDPFFSVVIPCFNSSRWILQALESVFAQDFDSYEVIVVDDGSTDNTLELLQSVGNRISIYQQKNGGAGSARNLAIRHARGEYLAFLDSDDLWPVWTLSTYAFAIQNGKNPVLVAGNKVAFSNQATLPAPETSGACQVKSFDCFFQAAADGIWLLYPGTVAIQRDAVQQSGGFAEGPQNAEDTHLFLMLGLEKGFGHIEAPIVNYYRRHENNSTNSLNRGYKGIAHLIAEEKRNGYPGNSEYRRVRRDIITKHARSLSVKCIQEGRVDWGVRLFSSTLVWNLELGRVKYVVGFPLWALRSLISQRVQNSGSNSIINQ